MGFFSKLKESLKKTKEAISYKLNKLFTGGVLNDEFYDELEMIMLSADIGAGATETILEQLRDVVDEKHIRKTDEVREELRRIMVEILEDNPAPDYEYPLIIVVAGVNGVGKTTAIGKLAKRFKEQKKSVTIVAGDTFRAAASDQLTVWAERAGVRIVKHTEGADPGECEKQENGRLIGGYGGTLAQQKESYARVGKDIGYYRSRDAGSYAFELYRFGCDHGTKCFVAGRYFQRSHRFGRHNFDKTRRHGKRRSCVGDSHSIADTGRLCGSGRGY